MINHISGHVHTIYAQSIVVDVHGFGCVIHCPHAMTLQKSQTVTLLCHMHWSTENGPILYGFSNELQKTLFLYIIQTPKIGPKIALNILAHISTEELIHVIETKDIKILSGLPGLGIKKAEQIILQLYNKVGSLITETSLSASANATTRSNIQKLTHALESLGYLRQEINTAIDLLHKHDQATLDFETLLRKALTHIAPTRS